MPATWLVEASPSARASCKKCKEKIEKGPLRWGKIVSGGDSGFDSKSYYHMDCLPFPVKTGLDSGEVQNFDALEESQQDMVLKAMESAKEKALAPKPPKKRAAPASDGKKAKKAKGPHPDMKVERKSGAKKNAKGEEISDDPVTTKYRKMTISELKDYLRLNEGLLTGVKGELVARCVDGERNGRLPKCPMCQAGKLRLTDRDTVACGGYFSEELSQRVPCTFEKPKTAIERGKWLVPGEDEPDQEGGAEGAAQEDEGVPAEDLARVVFAFEALPDTARPKDVATMLVKVGREMGLKLPSDDSEANQRAGTALMAHKDSSGSFNIKEAFLKLRTDCGTTEQAEAAAKAKEVNRPKAALEANQVISDRLDELAVLENKAQDSPNTAFKVRALVKAAAAVRGLTFEIKSGKQVSSGKQKVAGIGKGTAGILDDVLASGTTPRLDELRERFN